METMELLYEIEKIAHLGIYETDLKTGIWTGSDNFIEIFGLPKKDHYTVEEFQSIVHPDDFDDVMTFFGKCLQEKMDFNYEYRCRRHDDSVIYVLSQSKVYYDDDGTPLKIIGMKQDITERKFNELNLAYLNDLNHKKNEILSVVAHDLQNPVAQILQLNELLETKIPLASKEYLELQRQVCHTANNIILELIEIAELEDAEIQLRLMPGNINNIIEKSIHRFQYQVDKKKITIQTLFTPKAIAKVDEAKFQRVIDNLLSNAIKFSHEGGNIHIETQVLQDQIQIKITDEGIGMPKNFIPVMFDRFSKLTRRTGTNGERTTGLGLSIVKQIVDLHNGRISVKSEENRGTTFIINLDCQM